MNECFYWCTSMYKHNRRQSFNRDIWLNSAWLSFSVFQLSYEYQPSHIEFCLTLFISSTRPTLASLQQQPIDGLKSFLLSNQFLKQTKYWYSFSTTCDRSRSRFQEVSVYYEIDLFFTKSSRAHTFIHKQSIHLYSQTLQNWRIGKVV